MKRHSLVKETEMKKQKKVIPIGKGSNDRLSRAVSSVLQIMRGTSEAFREINGFGLPECGHDINRATKKQMLSTLSEFGFTPASFVNQVEERTSQKFAYFSGLSSVLEYEE
jgi:hypothetical protein